MFVITRDWSTAPLDNGVWYSTVSEGGCRFMAAWEREEEKGKAPEKRQRRGRDTKEADKIEVGPGVTVSSLRHSKAALIGQTQGLPKRRRLRR